MGSGSSKDASSASSLGINGEAKKGGKTKRRRRSSKRSMLMSSSCFGFTPSSPPPAHQGQCSKGGEAAASSVAGTHGNKSDGGSSQHVSLKHKPSPSEMTALASSDSEGEGGGDQDDALQNASGSASSSHTTTAVNQSTNPSDRPRTRFSLLPDGINFRLNRAVSLGSSVAHSILSSSLPTSANSGGCRARAHGDADLTQGGASTAGIDSSLDMLRDGVTAQARAARQAQRNLLESENAAPLRHSNRRMGSQEPFEGSVRFSRTLSVGRLRDRVLRTTQFSEGLFTPSLLYDRSIWPAGNASARQDLQSMQRTTSSDIGAEPELQPDTSTNNISQISSSAGGSYHHVSETLREASNRDLLERRSAFLERRRRIRSQVRALQRLGSRFENLSGHERSCILSGQHRTGRCTCRTSSRAGNSDEETSTRASISRIVMLAEALFEVLDEIHQQSVALSSRPSFSSIGSVPAPKEVVECLPVKLYRKPLKHQNDEAAQCYICLVEYEEGDCVRILPCNHEFHLTCVDKWLKEIHRVCPLCRGDVCRPDAPIIGKVS